jgi:starch-binding outer membrane protein, SusD/RagB family
MFTKINKTICMLGLGASMFLPLACSEDFLNQKNTQGVTDDAAFKTANDALLLINGIYDTFHDVDFMLKALWYQANFLSQDFRNFGADTFFETYEVPTSFGALDVFWKRAYTGISRANSAFSILEKMKTDGILEAELADRLLGEAYFLRGVFYYYLACNFGGVPLELKTVTDDGRHPKNTELEVFQSVESDMKAAFELLEWREDMDAADLGRATKGAALAYMGSAQMWIAKANNYDVAKYTEAVATFNKIEGHDYVLLPNFIDIHEFDNQNNKESIFEVQYYEQAENNMSWSHTNDSHWLATFGMPEEVSNFGYSYAAPELYNSFEPADKRKLPTVIGPGDEHPSPKIKISNYPRVKESFGGINTLGTVANPWKGSDKGRSGYYGVKTWRDPKAVGNTGNGYIFSGQNLIIMRYGELLLSKAEALIRSGKVAEGMDIINNQIRQRAGLGAKSAGDATAAIQILLDEYRHELSGEFSLWFLLRRSGQHLAYVKKNYDITVPPGKDLMPIPQGQIAVNPKLIQNEGY